MSEQKIDESKEVYLYLNPEEPVFNIFHYLRYENLQGIHVISSYMTRNFEFVAIGSEQCKIFVLDLITRQVSRLEKKQCLKLNHPMLSITFSYYYDKIIAGTTIGTLVMRKFFQYPTFLAIEDGFAIEKYHKYGILKVYHLKNNMVISISSQEIRVVNLEKLETYVNQQQSKVQYECNIKHINAADNMPGQLIIQKRPISSSSLHHDQGKLIICLGNGAILLYQIYKDRLSSGTQIRTGFPMQYIQSSELSEDARLLAFTTQSVQEDQNYFELHVMDLKRRKNIFYRKVLTSQYVVQAIRFITYKNELVIATMQGTLFYADLKDEKKSLMSFDNVQNTISTIYTINDDEQYPNLLSISQKGEVMMHVVETIKEDFFETVPFITWVEFKLCNHVNYKPVMKEFINLLAMNSLGIDKKQNQQQKNCFQGVKFFQPFFLKILDHAEYKKYYSLFYQKHKYIKRTRYFLKQSILYGAIQKLIQQGEQMLGEEILTKLNQEKASKRKSKKPQTRHKRTEKQENLNPIEETYKFLENTPKLQTIMSDDCLLTGIKLLQRTENMNNLYMIILAKCPLIFDERLPIFEQFLQVFPKMIEKMFYLDLSFNNLKMSQTKAILGLVTKNLKFLDLSFNDLAKEDSNDSKFNFKAAIKNIMTITSILSLRSNDFSDEQGELIIQNLENMFTLICLDLSQNLQFNNKTLNAIKQLLKQKEDLNEFDKLMPQTKSKKIKTNGLEAQEENVPLNKNSKTSSQIGLKLLIIEFNPRIQEVGMKNICQLIIEQQKDIENFDEYGCYIYVVNNKFNLEWDQSLLQLYHKNDLQRQDDIKGCFLIVFNRFWLLLTELFLTLKENLWNCLKQMFCSFFFLKKYIFCCYCVFLQSTLGLHISRLLGIKTADYEYNPKKDDLKTTLESYRLSINIFFWLNFFLFYIAVIFLPINYVLKCSGHQWTGHIIYAGYAFLVGIIEVVLALYCIKFGITHQEYIKGSFHRRLFFFSKDILLSQLARFDVYTDICFITTVMTCGTTQFIGYLAITIMGINLCATAYHVLRLLLSKFGGDENYIDYLCNYCAFLEINVVSLLLEKWTIQNTSNFLCFKGLPNRVYAACFRTFFEDLPQFFLQVAYLSLNPQQKQVEILLLSLASSTFSTFISITRSLTITKANRINDQIMMNEVKNKLNMERPVTDPTFNEQLQVFLHDYYENYDGSEEISSLEYGMQEVILRNLTDKVNAKNASMPLGYEFFRGRNALQKIQYVSKHRQTAQSKRKAKFNLKGITQLEDKQSQPKVQMKKKLQTLDDQIDELFEPFYFFINSKQAKVIIKEWNENRITCPEIAEVLLNVEINDYASKSIEKTWSASAQFEVEGGTFIESIEVQEALLSAFLEKIKTYEGTLTILVNKFNSQIFQQDLGCGSGFTSSCIIRLIQLLRPDQQLYHHPKLQFIYSQIKLVDHIPEILVSTQETMNLQFEELIQNQSITFVERDCRESIADLGTFDIIYLGFATKRVDLYEDMLKENGQVFIPILDLPQDHTYRLITKNTSWTPQSVRSNSGLLTSKELQYPQKYEYISIVRGENCIICEKSISGQNQFYCPWTQKYLCYDCGILDDDKDEIDDFSYINNLVFIPKCATENEMNKIDSYKFGKNLFPKKNEQGSRYHAIVCQPCERDIGDEDNYDPGPRYICLNCRPGNLGNGQNLDLCSKCGFCLIQGIEGKLNNFDMPEYERIEEYLNYEGHDEKHLLLKVYFYFHQQY